MLRWFTLLLLIGLCFQISSAEEIRWIRHAEIASLIVDLHAGDFDGNTLNDFFIAYGGTNGSIWAVMQEQPGDFQFYFVDNYKLPAAVAIGDFDNDHWPDAVAVGSDTAKIYMDVANAHLQSKAILDISRYQLLGYTKVVTGKFDGDSLDDIVLVTIHTMDLYISKGNGTFENKPLFDNFKDPNLVFECYDLHAVDIDLDGDLDLVTGEIQGIGIYVNDGEGNFSRQMFRFVLGGHTLIHPVDIDGDQLVDVVAYIPRHKSIWIRNTGNGLFQFGGDLPFVIDIRSFTSDDYNGDGLTDLFVLQDSLAIVYFNDQEQSFENSALLFEKMDNIRFNLIKVVDYNNDGTEDYVLTSWLQGILILERSSVAGVAEFQREPTITLHELFERYASPVYQVELYTVVGKSITPFHNGGGFELKNVPRGVFFAIVRQNGNVIARYPVVRE